jgi:hypothetical protein
MNKKITHIRADGHCGALDENLDMADCAGCVNVEEHERVETYGPWKCAYCGGNDICYNLELVRGLRRP